MIQNESIMTKFLKFLIYSIETLDGHRGTAIKFIGDKKAEYKSQRHYIDSTKPLNDDEIDRMVRH